MNSRMVNEDKRESFSLSLSFDFWYTRVVVVIYKYSYWYTRRVCVNQATVTTTNNTWKHTGNSRSRQSTIIQMNADRVRYSVVDQRRACTMIRRFRASRRSVRIISPAIDDFRPSIGPKGVPLQIASTFFVAHVPIPSPIVITLFVYSVF